MNKCKTCKWWDIKWPCDLHDGCKNNGCIRLADDFDKICLGSDIVFTNENFGCVLWEGKDEQV